MKKVFLLVVFFTFCNFLCSGQNTLWYFGQANSSSNSPSSYGLDFTTDPPTQRNGESGLEFYESVSVVSNTNGEVLFYSNGIEIMDASHVLMQGAPAALTGSQQGVTASSVQGAFTLLKPGSTTEYYLFTAAAEDGPGNGLRSNRIDLSLPGNGTVANPLGEVVSFDSLLATTIGEMMTAYGVCGTDTVWVIAHEPASYNFIKVLITSNGIQSVTPQSVSSPNQPGGQDISNATKLRGSMDFNSDGTKLILTGQWPIGTHIFDFNKSTGLISNHLAVRDHNNNVYWGYGSEFSPDGTKAYFCSNVSQGLWQYDVIAGTSAQVTSSGLHAEIITGPDDVLYIGKPNQSLTRSLATISNPNNPLGSIGYNFTAITFPEIGPGFNNVVSYAMPQGFYCEVIEECTIDNESDKCNTDDAFQLSAIPIGGTFGGGAYVDSAGMFDPAAAGVGTHWVTYDNGCEKPDSIQITVNECVPPCLDTTLANTIPSVCVDETIDLSAYQVTSDPGFWTVVSAPNGASPPASIVGQSVFDATGADFSTGDYTIRFTLDDAPLPGCPDSSERIITVNPKPDITLPNTSFCNGDSLELDAGNPGATYQWSNGETTQTQYFKTEGPHKVVVTLSGCIDSSEVTLTVLEKPDVSIDAPSASCSNNLPENLVAAPVGGQWYINDIAVSDPAQFNPSSLGDGSHEIKYEVINGNGCSDIDSISHTLNVAPQITNMPSLNFLCKDQPQSALSADPAGGQWYVNNESSSDQFNPDSIGVFSVKYVVSDGACSDSDSITITVGAVPDVVIESIDSICDNHGEEILNAAPAEGQWYIDNNPSSNQFNPAALGADTYNVKYVFSNGVGCSDSDSVSVTIYDAPTVNLGPNPFFCAGDSVRLDAGPGFSNYDWSTGDSDRVIYVDSPKVVVKVTVTDPNGCTGTDNVSVESKPLPSIDLGETLIVCEQDSITLDATHPDAFSYTWLPGNESDPTIRVGSEDSTYSVTILDNVGCEFTDSVQISQESLPTVNLGPDDIICDNVTTTLDAASSSDVSYIWLLDRVLIPDENSQTLEADSGEYIVTVSTENGCESSDTVNIDNYQIPNITLDSEYEFCQFDSVQIDLGSIGVTYVWSTGDDTESIWAKSSGTISVEVTDVNSCINQATVVIKENLLPEINLSEIDSACEGREIPLNVEILNGVSYEWSNGHSDPDYTLVGPDTLTVVVTDDKNCVDSATIQVKELPPLDLSNIDPNNQVCFQSEENNPIDAGDFEEAEYLWTLPDGSTEEGRSIVAYLEGDYVLNITDKFNCKGNIVVNNHVIKIPFVDLGPDTSFCSLGKEEYTLRLNLTDDNVLGEITWDEDNNNTNDTLFTATYTPITVIGTLTDIETGCSTKDTAELVEYCEPTILTFPNIIVPNGVTNTTFRPIELTDEVLQKLLNNILWSEFQVFNRWGIRVFQSENTLPRWEGFFENRPVPTGTYYWIYRYKDSSVKIHTLNGFVDVLHE